MAKKIAENGISVDKVYKLSDRHTWALDFYNQQPVKTIPLAELVNKRDIWVYATFNELEQLRQAGVDWEEELSVYQFRITRLQLKFLEPTTRLKKLNNMHLVHILQ